MQGQSQAQNQPQPLAQTDHDLDKQNLHSLAEDEHHFKEYSSSELKKIKIYGIITMIGGVALHLVLGTFYLWGGISPYVAAYMKSQDSSVTQSTMQIVFPILGIATNSVLSFGIKIAQKIGFKISVFLAGGLISLAFLILSFIKNLVGFILIYCFLIGIPSGLVYMLPVICGWKYFPFNRGLISGIIVAGYGFGSFIFNFVCTAIANPNNLEPDIKYVENGKTVKYFSSEVYENVPFMFRILALSYIILTVIATLLIRYPKDLNLEYQQVIGSNEGKQPSGVNHEKSVAYHPTVQHAECETIGQGIRSRPFWNLIFMVLFNIIFGMLMANCYKVYGQYLGIDDIKLTTLGSVSSAFNGCSRLGWAALLDRIGFKKVYLLIATINIICSAIIGYTNGNYAGYFILVCLVMCCEGGQLSCYPAMSAKLFGHKVGPVIYGFFFFIIGISNMFGYLLYKFAQPQIDYIGVFWVIFACACIAFSLGVIFKEDHEWKKN